MATEYAPLVAISNPLKRNTQEPSLTEIDMLRRLVEIAHAVEQYYEPGMHWLLGNEATVFQGPHFGLPADYVYRFHDRSRELARMVDPDVKRLQLSDQANLLWGTPERRAQWEAYEERKLGELGMAYDDPTHPEHAATRAYINTYIYPMATCISPYQFEAVRQLTVQQITEVYAVLKADTGSVIRGVRSLAEGSGEPTVLSGEQAALLAELRAAALDLTFRYRVTMDSRDELSAFAEELPPDHIRYTMVTKRDKAVLYPNSGRGANFPGAWRGSVVARARPAAALLRHGTPVVADRRCTRALRPDVRQGSRRTVVLRGKSWLRVTATSPQWLDGVASKLRGSSGYAAIAKPEPGRAASSNTDKSSAGPARLRSQTKTCQETV